MCAFVFESAKIRFSHGAVMSWLTWLAANNKGHDQTAPLLLAYIHTKQQKKKYSRDTASLPLLY